MHASKSAILLVSGMIAAQHFPHTADEHGRIILNDGASE
jgi:hypothetical protein